LVQLAQVVDRQRGELGDRHGVGSTSLRANPVANPIGQRVANGDVGKQHLAAGLAHRLDDWTVGFELAIDDEDEVGKRRNVGKVGEELALPVGIGPTTARRRRAVTIGWARDAKELADDDDAPLAQKRKRLDGDPQLAEREAGAVERRDVQALDVRRADGLAKRRQPLLAD
jgi:hypothetical protein